MNASSPVFIGGAGRSGTTLVVDMLGLHSRLSPIYETDFMLELLSLVSATPPLPRDAIVDRINWVMDAWTKPLPHRPHNKREHERFHHGAHHILFDRDFALAQTARLCEDITRGDAAAGVREFINRLFAEHCRLAGKPRWINKTPEYVQALPLLQPLFPELRFIHCIRDGRDIACSVVTRPWGPKTFAEAATWWRTKIIAGVQFAQAHPEQCLEVRYEDLLREPAVQLTRMLSWLGEEPETAAILAQYQHGAISLDASRVGGWQEQFSAEDTRAFHELAGDVLKHFGYEA